MKITLDGKNSVTMAKNSTQFYFSNQEALSVACFEVGSMFKAYKPDGKTLILEIVDSIQEKTGTVSKKRGDKRVIDTLNTPDEWEKGMKLKVVATKRKLVVTLHTLDLEISEREERLIKKVSKGSKLSLGQMFSGVEMKQMLRSNGLVDLSNDCTCKLAIELEQSDIQRSMEVNHSFWTELAIIASTEIHNIDFSSVHLEPVDVFVVNLNHFKKLGVEDNPDDIESQHLSANFISMTEILRRTNPSLILMEAEPSKDTSIDVIVGKDGAMKVSSPLLATMEGLLQTLGYKVNICFEAYSKGKIQISALSQNLKNETLEYNSQPNITVELNPKHFILRGSNYVSERQKSRELESKRDFKNGMISIGSNFSGGGIIDAALAKGLKDSGINSYGKYGIEISEAYAGCNLRNNKAWNAYSEFVIGDASHINYFNEQRFTSSGFVAGPPCVGSSSAGIVKNKIKYAEEHKLAGSLFVAYLWSFKASNCLFSTFENVRRYSSTFSYKVIKAYLMFLKYDVSDSILSGNQFGAIENRSRLISVAISKGITEINIPKNSMHIKLRHNLGDILDEHPDDHDSWRWHDYLDAKELIDREKGNNFSQQFVNSNSLSVPCVTKGYAKRRSSDVFVVWPKQELALKLYNIPYVELSTKISNFLSEPKLLRMAINFAERAKVRLNRRMNFSGSNRKESKIAAIFKSFAIDNNKEILISELAKADVYEEFQETLFAMSKATRIFSKKEHCRLKTVGCELVEGTSETVGHEILGNGVIFNKIYAVAKKIGQILIPFLKGPNNKANKTLFSLKANKVAPKQMVLFD